MKILQTFHTNPDLYGPIIAKSSGVPVIISNRRDLGFNKEPKHFVVQKMVNRFIDHFIADSEAVKQFYITKENIPEDKFTVVYNGIDLMHFDGGFDVSEIKKQLNIPSHNYVVGSMANLTPVKGHPYFLEAASIISQEISNVHFLVVGDGPLKKELEQKARHLGLSQKVTFTGSVAEPTPLLAIMDVSVLSSLSEGFSNTILESMAMGKPVVATNVGGNPEAVVDGETGFLVSPADSNALAQAILNILRNPDLGKRMGIAGRERVKKYFTLNKMIHQIEDLYDSLLIEKRLA